MSSRPVRLVSPSRHRGRSDSIASSSPEPEVQPHRLPQQSLLPNSASLPKPNLIGTPRGRAPPTGPRNLRRFENASPHGDLMGPQNLPSSSAAIINAPADTSASMPLPVKEESKEPILTATRITLKLNPHNEMFNSAALSAGEPVSCFVPPVPAFVPPPKTWSTPVDPSAGVSSQITQPAPFPVAPAHTPPPAPSAESVFGVTHAKVGPSASSIPEIPKTGWIAVTTPADLPKSDPQPDVPMLSPEEKREVWNERINLLAGATAARAEYQKLDREVADLIRLETSTTSGVFSEQAHADLHARLLMVQIQRDNKREELKNGLLQLAESDYWPFKEQQRTQPVPPSVQPHVATQVREIRDSLVDMRGLLEKLQLQSDARQLDNDRTLLASGSQSKQHGLSIDDASDRMSICESADGKGVPDIAELEDQVARFEEQFQQLSNDMHAHDDDLRAEFQGLLDDKVKEELSELRGKLASADEEISNLRKEMLDLADMNGALRAENAALTDQNHELKHYLVHIGKKQQDEIDEMAAEARQLREAMNARIPPPGPTVEQIISTVQPILMHSVQQEIRPLLDRLGKEVEEMILAHQKEVHSTIGPRLKDSSQMVDMIRAWAERIGCPDGYQAPARGVH
ncbi:uncharacterized protein LAESUDRAFT_717995 [Laetiporus sulphureus 93-53]|uniref:Uncharacterized protein n=1 Tax=Laetiporus sulphureus 93-53 TaxID=1314785 RepID=A0A165BB01_9APHY|nr:uncharacterized protein LAESUDRAFT_717995 [Laetiporus sulphureus 93-53]KZT00646.1 hypothetical protein LAESUDRAFT_717995 [Laetiporus sulphureus 93-53]